MAPAAPVAKAPPAAKAAPAQAAPAAKAAPAPAAPAPAPAAAKPASAAALRAAKAAAAKVVREVPKVSPLRGTPVGDYIDLLPGWQGAIVEALCEIVRAAAPEASVSIKWSQPVFEFNGPFAYIKPNARHVNIGFWRGTELEAPFGVLEGDGDRMRHVKIASLQQIEEGVLDQLVRTALHLNRQKGDPTRR